MTDDERRECSDPPCAQNWCDKHAKMPGYGLPEDHERREHWAEELTEHGFEEFWSLLTEEEKELRREFADAAMAVADEEIRGLAQEIVEMGGDLSARRREGERLIKLNRDLVRDCRAAHEDSARLRAELQDYRNRISWETNCGEHARLLDNLRIAEETISRVRAVLDEWRAGDVNYPYLAVRGALNGADDASA